MIIDCFPCPKIWRHYKTIGTIAPPLLQKHIRFHDQRPWKLVDFLEYIISEIYLKTQVYDDFIRVRKPTIPSFYVSLSGVWWSCIDAQIVLELELLYQILS